MEALRMSSRALLRAALRNTRRVRRTIQRTFVPNKRLAKDVRNLLFPYWGRDIRGTWPKGEYGDGPLGADQFPFLRT